MPERNRWKAWRWRLRRPTHDEITMALQVIQTLAVVVMLCR
ncbi:hypothetical protein ACU635_43355 [[Actinomadura] parvosata]